MRSLNSVGLGLSLVFGCLLLALVAELYYLLWWKKRVINREIQDGYNSPAREFFYMFCWKKPSSLASAALTADTQVHEPQASSAHQLLHNKDLWVRPFGGEDDDNTVEAELLRLQGLSGPPRFLFTIEEETKEDLESEDKSKKGSRGRSLSDIVLSVETPFFTPLASPTFFTPPITPRDSSYRGFSPLFQSASDAEFNRVWASPPPKFKFLRDAEEKLHRRKLLENFGAGDSAQRSDNYVDENGVKDEENGSFITLIVSDNRNREVDHQHNHSISSQYPSSSSQVLPLTASSPKFRPQSHKIPSSK